MAGYSAEYSFRIIRREDPCILLRYGLANPLEISQAARDAPDSEEPSEREENDAQWDKVSCSSVRHLIDRCIVVSVYPTEIVNRIGKSIEVIIRSVSA